MSKTLPYVEAIRDYDPAGTPSPFLTEPIERIAIEAHLHFEKWDEADFFSLVEGLDALIDAVETQDSAVGIPLQKEGYITSEDVQLLEFEGATIAGLYRHFVCSRVAGAELVDALMTHALASAAQANALAHQLGEKEAPGHEDYEEIAGRAMCAQEYLGRAELCRKGVSYAEWRTSSQSRKAAETRHARPQRIKDRFVDYFERGEFQSRADAARKFFDSLSEIEQRMLAPSRDRENAVRTLTAALRTYSNRSDDT